MVRGLGKWRFWAGVVVIAIALPLWTGLWGPIDFGATATVSLAQVSDDLFDLTLQSEQQFYNRDYARAEAGYLTALERLRIEATDDEILLPQVLHNLGRIYLLTERYGAAVPILESLEASGQASYSALSNLALAYFHTGNYNAAERVLTRVLAAWEAIRAREEVDDFDRVTLFDQQAHSYGLMQRVLVAQGHIEAALEMAERGRARALAEVLTSQRRAGSIPTLTVDQIRAVARRQNTTLVIYSALGDGRRVLGNEVDVETHLFIWVVSPSGAIAFRNLPLSPFWQTLRANPTATAIDPSPLENLVANTRTALGLDSRGLGIFPTDRRVTDDLPASNPLPLRSLHRMLIAPIAELLPADPEALVTFIPHGPLFLVPFAALQAENGPTLMEEHTLALASSVQTLALISENDALPGEGSLVVGNPVEMPRLPPDLQSPSPNLPPLPGAEQEATAIARLLNTHPLIRDQATETAVVQQMPTQGIIHLATHGLLNLDSRLNEFGLPVDANAPRATDGGVFFEPGGIIVDGNVQINGVDAAVALARERVVRVSAPGVLALAPTATDDGWLTAAEIATLDLRADLVVLSACDTGRGRITGDGVVGLTRAFLVAGANTVVVSLWQVPDTATATLMEAFYQDWVATGQKAQALRRAMLATQAQFPDPRNWSAFVLVGDAS
ncbi:CHAT domain-containing protein [Leptolyngbya sp. PCC 6406]|uniref:CHAT domain-containing protein n=1 Tax=Leptolyngbya sp. PCC 6406 TaxID=1173264 RepID=UPI0002AD0F99|nr:CHAT domain-containing tetratricopeptide repeat protein [Leptolyngbya sp. PCC 6406]